MISYRFKICCSLLLLTLPIIEWSSRSNRQDYTKEEIEPISWNISNESSQISNSQDIEKEIKRFMSRCEMHGVSLAISKGGKLLFASGYGLTDGTSQDQIEPKHLFRVASVSKLITAVAIMKLQEEGALDLDDRVFDKGGLLYREEYEPYKDKRLKDVTIRHLLMHSGGWVQRYGDPVFNPIPVAKRVGESLPINGETYIKFVSSTRLHFEPGGTSAYSNMGYVLLGEVISAASKVPYEIYARSVLAQAGIFDMHIGKSNPEDRYQNEVAYFEQDGTEPIVSFDGSGELKYKSRGGNNIPLLGAAGGWIASPVELVRLLDVIDGDSAIKDILTQESIDEMVSSSPKGFDPIGWRKIKSDGSWVRTGSMPGSQALLKIRNDGFNFAIVTNTSSWLGPKFSGELSGLMNRIIKSVDEWPDRDLFNEKPDALLTLDRLKESNKT